MNTILAFTKELAQPVEGFDWKNAITIFKANEVKRGLYLTRTFYNILSTGVMDVLKDAPMVLETVRREQIAKWATECMLRNCYFPSAMIETDDPKLAIEISDGLLLRETRNINKGISICNLYVRLCQIGDILRMADGQLFVIDNLAWKRGADRLILDHVGLTPLSIRLDAPVPVNALYDEMQIWNRKPILTLEEYSALGFSQYKPITVDEAKQLLAA